MALQRKQQASVTSRIAKRYPDELPAMPADSVSRFPSFSDWQKKLSSWWYDFRTALVRDLGELEATLQDLLNRVETLEGSSGNLSAITARLDSAETRLSALEAAGDCSVVSTSLSALSASFSAHIAATVAHGTSGAILGIGDPLFTVHFIGVAHTVTDYNCVIFCVAGVATAVTLPQASGHPGALVIVKDYTRTASTGNITVTPQGLETIDGGGSAILWVDGECVWFQSDGSNWLIV